MKDAIDKRNEQERIARCIVKRSNVIYITREEAERLEKEKKEREKADEILKRLEREAQEDEEKKAMEIQEMMRLRKEQEQDSGEYGSNPMDEVTQERVEAILSDKEKAIQKIIQDAENKKAVLPVPELEKKLEEKLEADNTRAEEADVSADKTVPKEAEASFSDKIG